MRCNGQGYGLQHFKDNLPTAEDVCSQDELLAFRASTEKRHLLDTITTANTELSTRPEKQVPDLGGSNDGTAQTSVFRQTQILVRWHWDLNICQEQSYLS